MVQLISEIGPDIPEIAKRLGQFKESVRYRYKSKILDKGFAVQALIDYAKLGLRHIEMVIRFADQFEEHAQAILTAMSDLCYVSGFEKVFPKKDYIVGADVPEELVDEYIGFMNWLCRKGLFTHMDVHTFDWFRRIPMRTQFYDFNAGRWDFDWSSNPSGRLEMAAYVKSERAKFDFTDLVILKELYIDATRSLVEISRKLGENYKRLVWHYNTHVLGLGLIKGFTVRWPGTKYDYKIDKVLHRQHRYFWIDLIVRGLSEVERMDLTSKINRLPFVWAEAGGKDYFVQLAFPVDFFTEAMQYIETILGRTRNRAELYIPDQTTALAFTISYKLYDQNAHKWVFDAAALENNFAELILEIKERRG